jgi:ribonuclease P protein component
MIPKIYKLKLREAADFFQKSKRYYSRYFLVFYRHKKSEGAQMVVVVPKKNIKLRVRRSKIKRQIYNLSLPLIKKLRGVDLVLVINKEVVAAKKEDIIRDLGDVFSKLS